MNWEKISINDPMLPSTIRHALIGHINEGDLLFQVETIDGIEWWHICSNGELIDVLWIDDE